jgi:hypothetical protein
MRAAPIKAGDLTLFVDVFRQLIPALEAERTGHQESRIGQIKRRAFILGA